MVINKTFPSVSQMNLRELHRATDSSPAIIAWCREHRLLAVRKNCHACGAVMIESAEVMVFVGGVVIGTVGKMHLLEMQVSLGMV